MQFTTGKLRQKEKKTQKNQKTKKKQQKSKKETKKETNGYVFVGASIRQ